MKICFFSLCIFVNTCQVGHISRQFEGRYNVDLDAPKQLEIRASDIFKSVKTIILETNAESIIGHVSEMQVFEKQIFILDKIGRSLLVFDMEGRFIRKIGRLGRGPGEFTSIMDFTIDAKNRNIFVLEGKRILKYAIEGDFINSVQIEGSIWFSYIQYFDGMIFAANRNPEKDENLLYIIEPETGKILNGYYSLAENNMGWNGWAPDIVFFNRLHGVPRYTRIFMNTVWSLDNMEPYISFPNENFPAISQLEEIKKLDIIEQHPKILLLPKTSSIRSYIETEDLIIFVYEQQARVHLLLYRKNEKMYNLATHFINDLVHGKDYSIRVRCRDEMGIHYEVTGMAQFILFKDKLNDNLDKHEQLLALDEESNPIIFYYELKDAEESYIDSRR